MCVLTIFGWNFLTTTLNSRLFAATNIEPVVTLVDIVEPTTQQNLSCSYPKVVSYLLKKFSNDQKITKINSATLRCTQPADMTPIQYANDLYAKLCKVSDVYDKTILNDIFIDEVDSSICHCIRYFWATHLHVDLTDIAIKTQSLQANQKGSVNPTLSGNYAA